MIIKTIKAQVMRDFRNALNSLSEGEIEQIISLEPDQNTFHKVLYFMANAVAQEPANPNVVFCPLCEVSYSETPIARDRANSRVSDEGFISLADVDPSISPDRGRFNTPSLLVPISEGTTTKRRRANPAFEKKVRRLLKKGRPKK